ncbi:hypothetical protein [Rossellomorea marisflavi]|uniref:hypothetical protein n=1 Tax=Rossellomorea marisflavi TaxID=189381 RepID=UPI00345C8760
MKVGDWVEYQYRHFIYGFTVIGYITEINTTQVKMQPVKIVPTRPNVIDTKKLNEQRFMRDEVTALDDELHPDDRAEIINLSLDSKDQGWFKELMEG